MLIADTYVHSADLLKNTSRLEAAAKGAAAWVISKQELQALKYKDDLDTFVARFKQLITAAELDLDSHGVIEIFKQGLKNMLIQNVLTADPPFT